MFVDEKTGVTIHADLDTTVSRATMRTQDLIPAFLDVLKDTMEYVQMMDYIPAYAMEDDDADWWDSEDASVFLNETLWNTLNSYAPDGYYFGCTEGDGSDYGFWKCRIWCNQEEKVDCSGWTTDELFDYATENGLIPENSTFEQWMNDRTDLFGMVQEHLDNN